MDSQSLALDLESSSASLVESGHTLMSPERTLHPAGVVLPEPAEIVAQFDRKVYATAFRFTREPEAARDLTQEIFVKVIRGLPRFAGKSQLGTWIFRIAVNTCLSYIERQRVERNAIAAETVDPTQNRAVPDVLTQILDREKTVEIGAALDALPEEKRTAIILHDLLDFSVKEAAEILEVPPGTVMSRLFYARSRLREVLRPRLRFGDEAVAPEADIKGIKGKEGRA